MSLHELNRQGVVGSIVEEDLATVIGWANGLGEGFWKAGHYVNEIKELSRLLGISLVHVPRAQNSMVNKLANWGLGLFDFNWQWASYRFSVVACIVALHIGLLAYVVVL